MVQWKLDHIVYTTDTLQPIQYWSTLEDDIESCQIGLPNLRIGSDHMPVGALFRICKQPELTQQQRDELSNQLLILKERHKSEIQAKEKEFDEKLRIIQEKLKEAQEQNQDGGDKVVTKKKKPKSKKGTPPKPIVDLLRKKRSAINEIKSRHKEERASLVKDFNNLQRLFIQRQYKINPSQWIERGC